MKKICVGIFLSIHFANASNSFYQFSSLSNFFIYLTNREVPCRLNCMVERLQNGIFLEKKQRKNTPTAIRKIILKFFSLNEFFEKHKLQVDSIKKLLLDFHVEDLVQQLKGNNNIIQKYLFK
jgi:hypothetical protein